ncbi:MAG: 4-hydroxy-tetrahydrodipicolinate synthase [Candidatus Omnitrophota bacterium]
MFKGSMVAIVTPFRDGKVDEKTLEDLVEFQIKNGTTAIVSCGTTGESPTLSYAEHERVTEVIIRTAKKRILVIAGAGSNSTDEAIMLTEHARKAGADAALHVTPYYNKPTQEGIYRHFKTIGEKVDLPIILYNIASRTGTNILPETIARLARDCKNIVGVKEASGNLDQMSQIINICPSDFIMLSGDDALTLPLLAIGGKGVISVVANIIPRDVSDMVKAFEKANIKKAQELHYKMLPLVKAMFIETNPIPVKTAMGMMKMCEPSLRLPMCEISEQNRAELKKALKSYKLIK